jgi:hypothetical protein
MNRLVCFHRSGTGIEKALFQFSRTSVSLPKVQAETVECSRTKPEINRERKQKNKKQDQLTKSVRYSMLQGNKAYPRLQNASFLNILTEGGYEHRSNLASLSR